MKITENSIINKYLKDLTFKNSKALKLEDDIYYDNSKKIVFSTDTYEEGVHFLKNKNPRTFIKKIFRSTISDIIAKGSLPVVYFLSLSLVKVRERWLNDFKKELTQDSKKFNLFLGGGDTIKSNRLTLSISVIGDAQKKPVLRSTAKINDDIYTTGNLGESYLGQLILMKKINLGQLNNYFTKKYFEPNLPFKFSKFLYKLATSSTDISDGLVRDLKNICTSSKCGAIINFEDIPFSSKTKKIFRDKKLEADDVFSKGDDYQILFTANPKKRKLIAKISKLTSTKVTRIGKIVSQKSVKLRFKDKFIKISSNKTGYIHNF